MTASSSSTGTRSDVLVHWSGKDLDRQAPLEMTDELRLCYVERLRSLYDSGIWFNRIDEPDTVTSTGDQHLELPNVPIVCFTELRGENSHAFTQHYGRLGLGLNRSYLLELGANPVFYLQNAYQGIINTNIVTLGQTLKTVDERIFKPTFAYFKPMSRDTSGDLDFYEEHEWRIVWSQLEFDGKTLPMPPEFHKTAASINSGVSFRFRADQVHSIFFPDALTIEIARQDLSLRRIWLGNQPKLRNLASMGVGANPRSGCRRWWPYSN